VPFSIAGSKADKILKAFTVVAFKEHTRKTPFGVGIPPLYGERGGFQITHNIRMPFDMIYGETRNPGPSEFTRPDVGLEYRARAALKLASRSVKKSTTDRTSGKATISFPSPLFKALGAGLHDRKSSEKGRDQGPLYLTTATGAQPEEAAVTTRGFE
jgi:hypothetical protein